MRRSLLVLASLVLVPVALYACSSDETTSSTPSPDSGKETSTTNEGGAGDSSSSADTSVADTSTGADTSTVVAVRCTQADFDKAAGAGGGDFTTFPGADISFPTTAAPAQYSNHCVKVKVGSKVTFAGKFSFHPFEANGGDTPSPFPTTSTDQPSDALTVTMTKAGTFGFECMFHPSIMFGAVQVVP